MQRPETPQFIIYFAGLCSFAFYAEKGPGKIAQNFIVIIVTYFVLFRNPKAHKSLDTAVQYRGFWKTF